jgi:hypothetical protein
MGSKGKMLRFRFCSTTSASEADYRHILDSDAGESHRGLVLFHRCRFVHRRRAVGLDPLAGAAQNTPPSIRRIGVKAFSSRVVGRRQPRA